jgi:hypothetical protein
MLHMTARVIWGPLKTPGHEGQHTYAGGLQSAGFGGLSLPRIAQSAAASENKKPQHVGCR